MSRYWHLADIGVLTDRCPLLGVKRTSLAGVMSAFDPKRTSASISCCGSEAGFSPYQSTRLSRYDASS